MTRHAIVKAAALALAIVSGGVAWWTWGFPHADTADAHVADAASSSMGSPPVPSGIPPAVSAKASIVPPLPDGRGDASAAPASAAMDPAAIQAEARLHRDPRTPPIDPPQPGPEPATPWELADPALYQAREQRQNEQVRTQFLQAAEARLPALRAAVAEMRRQGASAESLAMAEEKIRRLEGVHDQLARGEVLK